MHTIDLKFMKQLLNTTESVVLFKDVEGLEQACENGHIKSFKSNPKNTIYNIGDGLYKGENVQIFIAKGLDDSCNKGIILRGQE